MKKVIVALVLAVIFAFSALPISAGSSAGTFKDVPKGSWYYDGVYYCVDNNLFAGVTSDTFAPKNGMTRAMFVTVLASCESFNRKSFNKTLFVDVPVGKWYSVNINWAYTTGLVGGVGSGRFAPDKVVTRQELVSMLYKYAEYTKCDMTVGDSLDISSFPDYDRISSWAVPGFKWAIACGLVGGVQKTDGVYLAPNEPANRATVALMMMKYEQITENTEVQQIRNEVIRLVNVERQKNGLKPLTENKSLSRVAQYKTFDMHDLEYCEHISPTFGSPFEMMHEFGITYMSAGENLAAGFKTPAKVVDAWMNSPAHRANILQKAFSEIGIGYVEEGHYWTQMFIG